MSFVPRRSAFTILMLVLIARVFIGMPFALAQNTSTGTVTGTVTDPTGALVPDATITLTDPATKDKRTTVTNKDGLYVLQNVTPGTFAVTASKTGFATDEIQDLVISVGTQTTANFALAIGAESTTVEVQATNADLQTLNASIGATVTPISINALPSIQRDVSTFSTLQPGVTPGGSVAGTVSDQAVVQLDGGSNSSDMDGSMQSYTGSFGGTTAASISTGGASGVMPMPQDSVEEFKVSVVGQTADFNNSSGSQVQVVTKRGTNTVHGTVYEYYLDNNFNANTWQNRIGTTTSPVGTAKPSFHYSRFGAAAGGPITPYVLGGKTFLFGNYEGYRFPNSATYERSVPSAAMRAGLVTFSGTQYNLNTLDPRGIGINPTVAKLWAQLPAGNDPGCTSISGARCDGINTIGFRANVALPQTSNFYVARLDHDFGSKWHFNTSYRYFKLEKAVTNQVDIGGILPGDTLGVPKSTETRPQQPWFYVAGLTTNISSHTTNDFHYSYLRNFWSYVTAGAPPQLPGLGGAIEPFGEYSTTVLSPYNVDSQDIRSRVWDGHDHFLGDNVTMLEGNHLIQFGGQYEHNFAFHNRSDNGGGINYTTTYQLGDSSGGGLVNLSGLAAAGVPTSSSTNARIIDAVLGIVTDSQVAYTRSGNNLALNPPLTLAYDQSTIPFYNIFASDTWRLKPTLTLNLGVGYAIEMPPTEKTGKQVTLVDSNDTQVQTAPYLAARKSAALGGQSYDPQVGFALVGNVANGGVKYPYSPYYGSFSPRLSAAWNPHFDHDSMFGHLFGENATVLRGGYGRVYGRLNGVGLVLIPLLGPGLIQGVQCRTALSNGTCGSANPTDSNAFRIGVDGNSAPLAAVSANLPQPFYPGFNGAATANAQMIDPKLRPNDVDTFNLTVQRQVGRKVLVEVGYIGRLIHNEYLAININAVPYMMSQGGQTFASAYAAVETAFGCATSSGLCNANTTAATAGIGTPKVKVFPTVTAQPFFETSLAGTGYCTNYTNCTTAVVQKEASNFGTQKVFNLWSDLDGGATKTAGGFNFPRTMMATPIPGQAAGANGQILSGVSMQGSTGYGNYNGGFVSFKATDFHGLTLQGNFTYSKALGLNASAQSSSGLTPNDAFDLGKSYGVQAFNQKFIANMFGVYQTPWFKNQSGFVGRLAGGWTLAPIFTAGSGIPLACTTNSGSQSFGSADALNFTDNEQCVFSTPFKGGAQTHRGIAGGVDPNGISVGTATAGSSAAAQVNMFSNPAAVYDTTRPAILGIDERDGGDGPIAGLPYFNLDMSISKDLRIFERAKLQFSGIFTNILNHNDFANPSLSLQAPTSFGVVNAQGNTPRQIQMGIRASF